MRYMASTLCLTSLAVANPAEAATVYLDCNSILESYFVSFDAEGETADVVLTQDEESFELVGQTSFTPGTATVRFLRSDPILDVEYVLRIDRETLQFTGVRILKGSRLLGDVPFGISGVCEVAPTPERQNAF